MIYQNNNNVFNNRVNDIRDRSLEVGRVGNSTTLKGDDGRILQSLATITSSNGTSIIPKSKVNPKNLQLSFINGKLDMSQLDTPLA